MREAMLAQAALPPPVTPPTHSQLDAAVKHLVAEHMKTDPLLLTANLPDMVKAVAEYLRVPQDQVEPRCSDVEALTNIMVGVQLANAALAAGQAGQSWPPAAASPAAVPPTIVTPKAGPPTTVVPAAAPPTTKAPAAAPPTTVVPAAALPTTEAPAAAQPTTEAPAAAPLTSVPPAGGPSFVAVDGAGPPLFQQAVKNVLWRTLSLGVQHSILQLCEAVKSGKVPETFLAQYLELTSEATEDSPRAPHIDRLGFGALAVICDKLKVPVPTGFSKAEMDKARARLQGLPGQGPFDVCQQVCGVARDDISWLKTQDVLGAGSVVMYGKLCQTAKVVLRPEVNVKVDRCTNICTRELTYFTADGKYLKPDAIGDTLVRTQWLSPLSILGKPYHSPRPKARDDRSANDALLGLHTWARICTTVA